MFILQCRLINGCEVLVATPGSLMRAIDKQYTLLNRLSHLVCAGAMWYVLLQCGMCCCNVVCAESSNVVCAGAIAAAMFQLLSPLLNQTEVF